MNARLVAETHEGPSPIDVEIVPMRRRHVRSVVQIEQQVYPRPWSYAVFASEIAQRATRVYLVAKVEGRVVGYAGLLRALDDGHITTIAVDPAWQRLGVATRLLVMLARTAIGQGCRNLTLEVRVSNQGAQNLYRRFGFVPAGVRKNYYEKREDALVMWAVDANGPAYKRRLDEIERRLMVDG